jgi:hypothetical protein
VRISAQPAVDNPNLVIIELEFDTEGQAEALLTAMREVWSRVEGRIMMNPQTYLACCSRAVLSWINLSEHMDQPPGPAINLAAPAGEGAPAESANSQLRAETSAR